ncbi:LysM peptidoglycan-binding domain-containing M23 family metallopeptidase [Leptospira sp. 2 VSF19]|uniref:LysM peptidoglycan-binding domain-containing M23 family metallopeptidase n=1 Tax=Leptospira soteropolitanensis TaxID=2950025 RepID=A0AAW5VGS1_9LEPT|nr:LysM peptidoglycan-binding domain-containing M23 family metallopeptidase [Leptospira soteropolitanensis]MCW7494480.1 LysM peptidoglycan-binding domain-containing M23 family metallopeptidase [Leptospira soteropolitanensis]MCW7502074.1 LysM peptidoglycan-binding domain-containing M23 family metallopeptidase [Leptospira soteropolitanensis]MCW7524326.1 LysM peptidoglycan-binding domain-containing M23 family metallopeptidase [Leptospira soteropolitanensis]MCW7528191.1 LysM peptidoglycan-binding d
MRKLRYILIFLGFLFGFSVSPKQSPKSEIPSSYRVAKGDSWFGIARKFNISPETLAKLNGRTTSENLYERELLRIPKGNEKLMVSTESVLKEKPSFPLAQKEKVLKKYSELTYDPHKGIQFQRGSSSLVRASLPGKVVHVDYMDGYENFVILEHQSGLYSVYGNLERIQVTEGQQVKAKDRLGILSKDKGLYFQMNRQKQNLNPERIWEVGI